MYESGVSYYTKATVTLYFPEDDVRCGYCQLLGSDHGQKYCRRTGEMIRDDRYIGGMCPLEFEEEEK